MTAMGTVGRADIVETSMEVMNIEAELRVRSGECGGTNSPVLNRY